MIRFTVLTLVIVAATTASACEPEDCFLFNEDARERFEQLDSTEVFTQIVLLTNIAFHKGEEEEHKKARKEAQQLLKPLRQNSSSPTLDAYWWALRVMDIRDWGGAKKFLGGAKGKTREAFDSITVALAQEPENQIIRFIRVNVAIEATKKMSGLLDYALLDLQHLRTVVNQTDTVRIFFVELLSAKCYYWLGIRTSDSSQFIMAEVCLERAWPYACLEFYKQEVQHWRGRIEQGLLKRK